MNAHEWVIRFAAEVAFRLIVWVIELVGTSAYGEDVVHNLYARLERRGIGAAVRSALRSVPRAFGTRARLGISAFDELSINDFELLPAVFVNIAPAAFFFAVLVALFPRVPTVYEWWLWLVSRPTDLYPTILLAAGAASSFGMAFARTRHWVHLAIAGVLIGCGAHGLSPVLDLALATTLTAVTVLVLAFVARRIMLTLVQAPGVTTMAFGVISSLVLTHLLIGYARTAPLAIHLLPSCRPGLSRRAPS